MQQVPRFKIPGSASKDASPTSSSQVQETFEDDRAPSTASFLLSHVPLQKWSGDITIFDGMLSTQPSKTHAGLTWSDYCGTICPAEPVVVPDKNGAKYFLPCLLSDAPLTGKTLERAQQNGEPTVGKMRSKDHVTKSKVLLFDYDGIAEKDFERIRSFLEEHNLTYIAYTTFSHGMEGKPGMYVRLCIPVDRPLDAHAYTAAWNVFVALLPVAPDSSGSKLCQQQGIWTCHPDRKDKAQRWPFDGCVLNINALPQRQGHSVPSDRSSPETPSPKTETAPSIEKYPPSDVSRVAERCNQIKIFRDTKGANQKEPLWFDCLGVVGHCVDGRKMGHEWSSRHPGYSKTETDRKLDLRLQFGPTTCEQFGKTNPSGCQGCKEKVKSPILLGIQPSFSGNSKKQPSAPDSQFEPVAVYREPIDLAQLLDELVEILTRFIIMDPNQRIAIAHWIVHSWFIESTDIAPLLLITAAERESGKSQLLSLVAKLCRHPLTVSNSTAAFLFRSIAKWQPTLFIDEVDTFVRDSADQKGLINAGHTRESAWVGRVVGDSHEPTMFPVFCAKALAGIDLARHLPDATMSRGILISLRRKLPDEKCERLRHADGEHFKVLKSKLARFAQDASESLKNARPTLPEALSDRQQDNWEPLFAIAEYAGPKWLARCEEAALTLSRAASRSEDTGNCLLGDIREIFAREKCLF